MDWVDCIFRKSWIDGWIIFKDHGIDDRVSMRWQSHHHHFTDPKTNKNKQTKKQASKQTLHNPSDTIMYYNALIHTSLPQYDVIATHNSQFILYNCEW